MDLNLYKARVVSLNSPGNDTIQLRRIPDQLLVDKKQSGALPWFPPFVKGSVIHCKTEETDGDDAEVVWCVANSDFTFGYVIDLANVAPNLDGTGFEGDNSFGYKDCLSLVARNGLDSSRFVYEDMKVVFFAFTDDGGIIELYNFRNGDFYLINASGTCIMMQQGSICIRCGSPNEKFSKLSMTPTQVKLQADSIILDAEDVSLGMDGLVLAALPEYSPPIARDGIPIVPINHIHA